MAAADFGKICVRSLAATLAGLTRADAEAAFAAIVIANPAGLGAAPRHDVRQGAETTLLEAMKEAAERDRIAYQYATDYADVFGVGLKTLEAAARSLAGALAGRLRLSGLSRHISRQPHRAQTWAGRRRGGAAGGGRRSRRFYVKGRPGRRAGGPARPSTGASRRTASTREPAPTSPSRRCSPIA